MKDKDLRKMIGSRIKQRRTELNLHQKYIAEKMDVNTSTIQRYEAGTIDNTKKLILEGLADALHVSVEWLKGETDEYETDITDKRDLQIRDLMGRLSVSDKEELSDEQFAFSKTCSYTYSRSMNCSLILLNSDVRIIRMINKIKILPRQWELIP